MQKIYTTTVRGGRDKFQLCSGGYIYECGVSLSLPLMQRLHGDVYIIDNF